LVRGWVIDEPSHRCVLQILQAVGEMDHIADQRISDSDRFTEFDLVLEEIAELSLAGLVSFERLLLRG
jgi:hypothetical protein